MAISKITTKGIADDAVTSAKLAPGSVTVNDIPDGEITADKLHTTLDLSAKTLTLTQASVTAHESALTVTQSQISDLSTTTDLSEGSNLYYTDARADARIAAASITDLSDADQSVQTTDNVTFANITATGYVAGPATFTIDPAAVGDNTGTVVIAGNLQVDGTTTTINSTTVEVGDKNIVLGADATANSQNDGAGITVLRPTSSNAILSWDETVGQWEFSHKINVTGTVTADGLTVDASSPTIFFKPSANTETGYITFNNTSGSARGFMKYNYSNDSMSWRTAGISDRMTIDAGGSLMVGKTSLGVANLGFAARYFGSGADGGTTIELAKDNATAMYINRASSDGSIIDLRKDNTNVGKIGAVSDDLYIHTGDTGLRFNDGNDQIWPVSSGGSSRDDAISLGGGTIRFKDLYLSGKITNDGTGGISIDADGKVGIGTDSPTAKLQVLESTANTALDVYTNDVTGAVTVAKFRSYDNTNGEVDRFKIKANGDVSFTDVTGADNTIWQPAYKSFGIGNQNPALVNLNNGTNLIVGDGTGTRGATIYSSTTGEGRLYFIDSYNGAPTQGGFVYDHSDDSLAIRTNNEEQVVIKSNGTLINNNDQPTIRPSLLLDFANSKVLDRRLTFSRGSTGMYFDGSYTKADENLLRYSTDLSNGYYTQRGFAQLSSTELAPDGTNTAFKFQENNTNSNPAILPAVNVAGSGQNTFSVYLRADSATTLYLSTDGATLQTQFNITTTWQRFFVTANNAPRFHVGGFGTVTQGGGQTFYMWGPQQEYGSTPTNYTPTGDSSTTTYQPKLVEARANEPRFDHDPFTGESKGLLIEQSATNVSHYSTAAFNATTGNTVRYANQGIAPDGTNTADAIMATPGTGGSGYAYGGASNWINATGDWTLSFYYKRVWGTGNVAVGRGGTPGNIYAYINGSNVVSGGVSGSMTLVSASREDIGNGWYRAIVTATSSSSTAGYGESQAFPAGSNSKYLVWGLQLENQGFASSYIPTSGSSVTRSQDSLSIPSNSINSWYTNSGENTDNGGTYLYEWKTKGIVGSNDWGLLWRNASNGARMGMYVQSNGQVYSEFSPRGTDAALSAGSEVAGFNKLATAFAKNDIATSLNGSSVVTDTTCEIPNDTQTFYLGWYSTGNGLSAHVKKFSFWPERLSNATLQALSED